jgi:hypothetical protein
MADYGIKISLPGKDISSTNPQDFVFHSGFGSVKIFAQPTNKNYLTVTIGSGSSTTLVIPHGLSFIPMVMWFTELKPGSGHWYNGGCALADPTDLSGAITMDSDATASTYVDATNINVKLTNNTGGSLTIKYYYFIFADNG